ncbi:hypothetical protein Ahy_A10g048901 [Arachis hypogaea]|uniref:Uncharacterized protein n=1 Tax=Arachis hypogaea TaxID=3818 RepID=A0A445B648_ARAHY|nr:hypothetical protein Ahy_A10g048901 [Arachis hypogaea]
MIAKRSLRTIMSIEANVMEVTNTLVNKYLFEKPSFMHGGCDYDDKRLYHPQKRRLLRVCIRTDHILCEMYDHSKLYSNIIAEAIRPLIEDDPSIKVKSVITEVPSKFNYTIGYHKAWLAKQKAVKKIFGR